MKVGRANTAEILDTTLREGEQCFGVLFPIDVKKRIALLLDAIGVDFIEVGHPAAAPSIRKAIYEISQLKVRSNLIAHARLDKDEIRLVKDLGLHWIGLFCGISERSLTTYGLSRRALYQKAADTVHYAKDLGLSIKFTAEDASRTNSRELIEFYSILLSMGVDRLSFADTLGIMRPGDVEQSYRTIIRALPSAALHFHFHDDFGFANANAQKAIECGARCVDVSVSGIGERAGIVSLEHTVAFLAERSGKLYDKVSVKESARVVKSCINVDHYQRRRFAHKSGIHIDGIIKDTGTYEPVDPLSKGGTRIVVLSKLIGRSGIRMLLSKLGFKHDEKRVHAMLEQVKTDELLELSDPEEIGRYFTERGLVRQIA